MKKTGFRIVYETPVAEGRVLQRELFIEAPNSRAALAKALRLLYETEKTWKVTEFRQVDPEAEAQGPWFEAPAG